MIVTYQTFELNKEKFEEKLEDIPSSKLERLVKRWKQLEKNLKKDVFEVIPKFDLSVRYRKIPVAIKISSGGEQIDLKSRFYFKAEIYGLDEYYISGKFDMVKQE